jgi:hypothetical protein
MPQRRKAPHSTCRLFESGGDYWSIHHTHDGCPDWNDQYNLRKPVKTEKGADFEEDEVCACSYYFLVSGFAASVIGLGLGAAFGFGVQKSGEAATMSTGGLLSSGRKRVIIVSDPCTDSATIFK